MESIVGKQLTEQIIHNFLEAFGLEHRYEKLGDFENYVFEVTKVSEPCILRITHSSHRSLPEIEAELDWIDYLANHGVCVSRALSSSLGRMVVTNPASDGSVFYGCLFREAPGNRVELDNRLPNRKLIRSWGKTIGTMHKLSKTYQPNDEAKRKAWHQDELLDVERYLPASETVVINHARQLVEELHGFPVTYDNYGLIHNDLHSGNFHFDGEQIHVYDFDDCCHLWYVSDIAKPVYYSVQFSHPPMSYKERDKFAKEFLTVFLEGYEEETKLPDQWTKQFSSMLLLRDVTLYSVLHKKMAPFDRNQKIQQLMAELKSRIEQKQPIITFIP
ncbi:phosphotransferase enzyme family protein [Virgibacillus senegalensis]|uniref:phosphotransferase enzyme family protein n=1 Tax=Virgibacillus senegalensis TaxID=1499679 RepID=UPI00069D74CA|nr:phosphotransferase [Virgibacillus senegalensis]